MPSFIGIGIGIGSVVHQVFICIMLVAEQQKQNKLESTWCKALQICLHSPFDIHSQALSR